MNKINLTITFLSFTYSYCVVFSVSIVVNLISPLSDVAGLFRVAYVSGLFLITAEVRIENIYYCPN